MVSAVEVTNIRTYSRIKLQHTLSIIFRDGKGIVDLIEFVDLIAWKDEHAVRCVGGKEEMRSISKNGMNWTIHI